MSQKNESEAASAAASAWSSLTESFSESSKQMADAWSKSTAPFMFARFLERPAGMGGGNEMSEAIEKMAQGPRLADMWDIDRKLALVFSAWMEMRAKLAKYNAVTATPWTEASRKFIEAMTAAAEGGKSPPPNWREAFSKWSEISNVEMVQNQRSEEYLSAQKELLLSGLELRSRQDEVAEAAAAVFGMPGKKDFDEVTRQLTELRREVRALGRRVPGRKQGARAGSKPAAARANAENATEPTTEDRS